MPEKTQSEPRKSKEKKWNIENDKEEKDACIEWPTKETTWP